MLGCKSNPFMNAPWKTQPSIPRVALIDQNASLDTIISVVNSKVNAVKSLSTEDATLTGQGLFQSLRGKIYFKRPDHFHMLGFHGMTGEEIDMGRNSELTWLKVIRMDPPATLFCRNDQYDSCKYLRQFPIDPQWVIDALGMGTLDPNIKYEGPFQADSNHLELRVKERSAAGERTRVILINRNYGLPAAQHIFDQYGLLAVEASVKSYRTDPATGIIIPQNIEIRCPKLNNGKELVVKVNMGNPVLNQLDPAQTQLWVMPVNPKYPPVDMAKQP